MSYNKVIKIVVSGIYLYDGMAGTKRVRALLDPLIASGRAAVSNIVKVSQGEFEEIDPSIKKSQGIDYEYIRINRNNPFSLCVYFFHILFYLRRREKESCRMVYYHYGHPDILSVWGIFAAKMAGYKTVFDIIEDNEFLDVRAGLLFKVRLKSSSFFFKKLKYLADGCIAISSHTFDLVKGVAPHCPATHIPISIDIKNFTRENRITPDDKFHFFWGGQIAFTPDLRSFKDGIKEMLDAFDEICGGNDILDIAGSGSRENVEYLKVLINGCRHRERIIYHGFLSPDNYFALLRRSDAVIVNRVDTKYANAGFPYKLGECLAAGKAVIATDVSDVGKYITDGQNALLVKPSDQEALKSAMVRIKNDILLRKKISGNAVATAEKYFSSEKLSGKFCDFIEHRVLSREQC